MQLIRHFTVDRVPLEERLSRLVHDDQSDPFTVPGAVLAVAAPDGATAVLVKGRDGQGVPLSEDSLFQILSASKLATGLGLLRLIDMGELKLDDHIAAYLPEARCASAPGITIRRLMSHTSGLPFDVSHDLSDPPGPINYGSDLHWPGDLADACLAAEQEWPAGERVSYSNVAWGLLALAANRITGDATWKWLQKLVSDPLGIECYLGSTADREPVAISDVSGPNVGTEIEPYNSRAYRGLGTPWSGIQTTAEGLLRLVTAYSEDAGMLSVELARAARTDQTGGLPGGYGGLQHALGIGALQQPDWQRSPWGLGIELQGGKAPHWSYGISPGSFGQVGSSGCIAWYDPDTRVAWALLGTRTTDRGWLLRQGSRIARAAIVAVQPEQ